MTKTAKATVKKTIPKKKGKNIKPTVTITKKANVKIMKKVDSKKRKLTTT